MTGDTKDLASNNTNIEIPSTKGELTLTQMKPEDVAELFSLIDRNREHLSQHGDTTAQKYITEESLLESVLHPTNPSRLRFVIKNKEGQIAGSINITPDEGNHQRAEIGYYLGAEFQGHGYMISAVETLTQYGFEHLGYETIYGMVAEANRPSARVLIKAGYTETEKDEGDIVYSVNKNE